MIRGGVWRRNSSFKLSMRERRITTSSALTAKRRVIILETATRSQLLEKVVGMVVMERVVARTRVRLLIPTR